MYPYYLFIHKLFIPHCQFFIILYSFCERHIFFMKFCSKWNSNISSMSDFFHLSINFWSFAISIYIATHIHDKYFYINDCGKYIYKNLSQKGDYEFLILFFGILLKLHYFYTPK